MHRSLVSGMIPPSYGSIDFLASAPDMSVALLERKQEPSCLLDGGPERREALLLLYSVGGGLALVAADYTDHFAHCSPVW